MIKGLGQIPFSVVLALVPPEDEDVVVVAVLLPQATAANNRVDRTIKAPSGRCAVKLRHIIHVSLVSELNAMLVGL